MNTPELETRLKNAAAVAAPPRSIVDDVMRRLPLSPPRSPPASRWRHPFLATGLAAVTGLAAMVAIIFLLAGPSVRLTLADVQSAVVRQQWVHIQYDAGQIKENWINLQTGESFATRFDGGAVYNNEQTNVRLWHWKDSGVIDQDTPTIYSPRQTPEKWTPQTAWDEVVGPYEKTAASTQSANSAAPTRPSSLASPDTLDGKPVIRFDNYGIDSLGNHFLYSQLWADPRTHLPLRVKTRLQLGERESSGKEWSTGDYDFPATGPADLYALGVPAATPVRKVSTVAPADVRPIVDAINRYHDGFLKNYRSVVVANQVNGADPVDSMDIIWRDGDKVRADRFLPAVELQDHPNPPLPALSTANLLDWAAHHEAIDKSLMTTDREYSWWNAALAKSDKPRVQVSRHGPFPLLPTNSWPDAMQWPTRYWSPDFRLLGISAEAPAGCIGLTNDDGNTRSDYYVDPANDYVCVKLVRWTKHGGDWVKTRDEVLSGLHRVAGCVVAAVKQMHDYGDQTLHTSAYSETTTIDLTPMNAADYPLGIFDPVSLTHGATVVGY